jgi:hypothetical protein
VSLVLFSELGRVNALAVRAEPLPSEYQGSTGFRNLTQSFGWIERVKGSIGT